MMPNYKYYICTFSLFEKLSILTWRLLEGVSIVNLKPTINYNNILIKALFINIVAVSDSETHSERLAYIKDSERYYIVFVLSSWIVLISGSLLRQVILKIFCYQKGFPETPETPLYTPLTYVCMYVCMYACMYACIYVHMYGHNYVYSRPPLIRAV